MTEAELEKNLEKEKKGAGRERGGRPLALQSGFRRLEEGPAFSSCLLSFLNASCRGELSNAFIFTQTALVYCIHECYVREKTKRAVRSPEPRSPNKESSI